MVPMPEMRPRSQLPSNGGPAMDPFPEDHGYVDYEIAQGEGEQEDHSKCERAEPVERAEVCPNWETCPFKDA